jgi:hypothetical protein
MTTNTLATNVALARVQNCAVRNPRQLIKHKDTTFFLYVGGHMYLLKVLSKNYAPGHVAQWQATRLGDHRREYILTGTSREVANQLA